jgi:hypothetical protein
VKPVGEQGLCHASDVKRGCKDQLETTLLLDCFERRSQKGFRGSLRLSFCLQELVEAAKGLEGFRALHVNLNNSDQGHIFRKNRLLVTCTK